MQLLKMTKNPISVQRSPDLSPISAIYLNLATPTRTELSG